MEVTLAQRPQSLPSYRYEPLKHPDSTRVLVLQPAVSFKSQLRCSMIQYSRQEQLRSRDTSRNYSAVSYTWGLPDFSVDLVIDQSSVGDDIITHKESILRITPTVDSILRYLRDPHKSLYLWIDALCIDQQDENDKAVQIPQMGEIYRCAETVHVWLGDVDADEVAVAFANIRMAQALSAATESYKTDLYKSLTMLTQKPWFSRRWVIQEVKLADRAVLHYGEHSIEYARFRTAWRSVESRMVSQNSLRDLRLLLKHDVTEDLLELLWGFHTAECSDPRDRLAAFYGFLPQSEQPIDLQYGQIGWKDMYRRLTQILINKDLLSASRVILHLVAFGSIAGRSLDDFEYPSWIPDWSGVRQLGMASGEFHMDRLHSTDRGDKPWMDCSNKFGGLKTECPSPEPHTLLQEAQQDIPGCAVRSGSRLVRYGFATSFSAGQTKLRVRWSPFRGGLYGKNARLIMTLPREPVVAKDELWERTLSCLQPIQDRFVTPWGCIRITALFAITLKGKDVVSEDNDQLSSWPLHTLMEKLYETVRTGFENPESLDGEQKLLLTLIGGILQKFALVELHPLPYSLDSPKSNRWDKEYGLAPHDMKFSDVLIPFDGTEPKYSEMDEPVTYEESIIFEESETIGDWRYVEGFGGQHMVEVLICLRPISPKLVYEVSNLFQDRLPFPFNKIAAMVDNSQRTYRDLQDDQVFYYPPSQVRTARFLGAAYCVSNYRIRIEGSKEYDLDMRHMEENRESVFETKFWKDYRDARAAGLCRPVNIDIV